MSIKTILNIIMAASMIGLNQGPVHSLRQNLEQIINNTPRTEQYDIAQERTKTSEEKDMIPEDLEDIEVKLLDYAIVVDKASHMLSVYQKLPNEWVFIRQYPVGTGRRRGSKEKDFDKKTPGGIYKIDCIWSTIKNNPNYNERLVEMNSEWVLRGRLDDKDLGLNAYGEWFFGINYPNEEDKKQGKTGCCIGIHGTKYLKSIGRNVSGGCIRMHPHDIAELSFFAKKGTPVIITDGIREIPQKTTTETINLWFSEPLEIPCPEPEAPSTRKVKTRVMDDLLVNTADYIKTAIIKDEKEGTRDMRRLLSISRLEEAWVYIPKYLWVEYGIESKKDEVSLSSTVLLTSAEGTNELILYHIHPNSFEQLINCIQKEERSRGSEREVSRIKSEALINKALPSQKDLKSMVGQARLLHKRGLACDLTHKICSFYGVTDFSLTKEGKEFYTSQDSLDENMPFTYLAQGNGIIINGRKVVQIYIDPKLSDVDKIKKLCRNIGNGKMSVSFTPYSEIKY